MRRELRNNQHAIRTIVIDGDERDIKKALKRARMDRANFKRKLRRMKPGEKEKDRVRWREWRRQNAAKNLERKKKWKEENRERVREYDRRYYELNPQRLEYRALKNREYRARKKLAAMANKVAIQGHEPARESSGRDLVELRCSAGNERGD